MTVTKDDFNKIWASESPLTPYSFSASQYKEGWNFIGSTPPSRQMWDSIQKKNDEKFKYLRDNFGTPNIVTSSSQMTDTDKVYVYMGSEAGWNSGHWYYYNEGTSSWEDGGVYNSVAFVTDTTLSIAGQPADAKAVGDALALKADIAGCTFTGNVSVNADFSVTGDSTLTGNVSASGDVNATGDVTADNISATTNGTIGGALSVAGASTLTGNVSAGADVVAVGDVSSANIIASNNANIGGNATVTGSVASASLTTTADGTIGGNLSVSGTTTLTGDVSASADLIVAGDSSLTNLSVSGTTALAGTSTAPTPSADDNSTKIATTEYVQTEIKPIEVNADIVNKRVTNIEKLLQGNLYDYQTDSNSAYTKTVPAGAMPYAGIERIGGKTLVWNQLVNSGTTSVATISGHKYYTVIDGTASIVTADGTAITVVDDTADMVCDLTLMFGAGNEPSTVEKFQQMFPASYYPYNAGTLLSAGVTEAESVGKNLFDLQNMTTLFGSLVTLTDNGFRMNSINTVIDKKLYDNKNRKTGSLTISYKVKYDSTSQGLRFIVYYTDGTSKQFLNNNAINVWGTNTATTNASKIIDFIGFTYGSGGVPSNFEDVQFEWGSTATSYSPYKELSYPVPAEVQALEGYGWSAGSVYNYVDFERKVFVKNVGSRAYASGDESDSTFITDGTTTYYPLNPAIETDISAYITDDNLIQVESGGTLTFPNSNGTDYQIPVPSAETFMIDLQEAINNG